MALLVSIYAVLINQDHILYILDYIYELCSHRLLGFQSLKLIVLLVCCSYPVTELHWTWLFMQDWMHHLIDAVCVLHTDHIVLFSWFASWNLEFDIQRVLPSLLSEIELLFVWLVSTVNNQTFIIFNTGPVSHSMWHFCGTFSCVFIMTKCFSGEPLINPLATQLPPLVPWIFLRACQV